MPPAGINRYTGQALTGFDQVQQSLFYLFSLHIGTRVRRRTVGSSIPSLLGKENLTPTPITRFWYAMILACEAWEPRFAISQVIYPLPENPAASLRKGALGVRVLGEYMPNALQGDFTVDPIDGQKDFVL